MWWTWKGCVFARPTVFLSVLMYVLLRRLNSLVLKVVVSLSSVDAWRGKNFGKRVEGKSCGGTSGCDLFCVGVTG
eukprot:5483208-Amphidinium_carterae.5